MDRLAQENVRRTLSAETRQRPRSASTPSNPSSRASTANAPKAKRRGLAKKIGGGLVAVAVVSDATGLDPVDLALKGVGDLIHGTDNFGQTVADVPNAFERSLIRQVFTDPEGAGTRVIGDLEQTRDDAVHIITNPGETLEAVKNDVINVVTDPLSIFQ